LEAQHLYQRAISRIQADLGWTPPEAHAALAHLAAGHGVFLHDVAAAVLFAPSLANGLYAALKQVVFKRRAT
jgi:ANTAR domain-containing protein